MHVQYDAGAAQGATPFFSVCIPQHNRTSFVVEAIRWLGMQTFRDVEICVSDDCSTDGREDEVVSALRATGLSFNYFKQPKNLRYDGNTRAAIDMSRGRFCYLLGNDDRLATEHELQQLHDDIQASGEDVGVAIGNFYNTENPVPIRRMVKGGIVGAGPWTAAANFRNFSFVSGVILNGPRARALTTNKWDGSEMYQMYIGCRIIAEGRPLLAIERVTIAQNIQIPGEQVDTLAGRPRVDPCPIEERKIPLRFLAALVFDAVEPYVEPERKGALLESLMRQLIVFTYGYWILRYRRIQSWRYAVGICLGMRPHNLDPDHRLGPARTARISVLYGAVTVAGLAMPMTAFEKAQPALHRLAKLSSNWFSKTSGAAA